MDPDVLYLLVISIGLPIVLAVAVMLIAKVCRAPTVLRRWGFYLPVGYAIAVASTTWLAQTSLTGTGEGNLSAWMLLVLIELPRQATVALLGVNRQLSYWPLISLVLLILMLVGIAIDLIWAMASGRTSRMPQRRPGHRGY
jgi:hypothetical protein